MRIFGCGAQVLSVWVYINAKHIIDMGLCTISHRHGDIHHAMGDMKNP